MQLKRKRSCSELSSPPSAISKHSPLAHLGGRTMKRFRGSRPSEDIIHRNTINVLFNAQRMPSLSLPLSASPSLSSSSASSASSSSSLSPSPSPSSSQSNMDMDMDMETDVDVDVDSRAELLATGSVDREHGQASLHRFWKRAAAVQTARAAIVDIDGDMDMNANRVAGNALAEQQFVEKKGWKGGLGWAKEMAAC